MPYYGARRPIKFNEQGKIRIDTIYYHLPGFRFYNQYGQVFSSTTLSNKVWVASFTSFSGKDAPSLAVTMNRIEERTNLDTALRLVTFVLDSVTAKNMLDYANMIHTTSKRRVFLCGNKDQMPSFASDYFYKPVDTSSSNGFIHYFLIDKKGCIRGIYNGLHIKDVDNLIDDISVLEAAYYIQHEKEHKEEHDNDAI